QTPANRHGRTSDSVDALQARTTANGDRTVADGVGGRAVSLFAMAREETARRSRAAASNALPTSAGVSGTQAASGGRTRGGTGRG
ncbi:hypothetical protein MUQ28_10225, partial [Streptococcus suis]|uniref:hypothetical protein n=1 Tax=Streptococcus suis TaxID=1307 RepID=UPI001FD3C64C